MSSKAARLTRRAQLSCVLRGFVVSLAMLPAATTLALPAAPATLEWSRAPRTSARDQAYDIAADSLGNVFVAGDAATILSNFNTAPTDGFLTRYNAAGDRTWTVNIGAEKSDYVYGVSADDLGGVYAAGTINGAWGHIDQSTAEAFVRKYDASGNLAWAREFGTSTTDEARDVTRDFSGNVIVAGITLGDLAAANAGSADVFVSKFNSQGDQLWSRQIGSNQADVASAAATDSHGNVYVTGSTDGSLGGVNANSIEDLFVSKFDANGAHLWTRQFGNSGQQFGNDVIVDADGNAYIAGTTSGSWGGPAGGDGNATNPYDAFLMKLDADGNQQWLRQFGGYSYDSAQGVAFDRSGNACVTGHSNSNLPGTNADGSDAFLMNFSPAGDLLWTAQAGPAGMEEGFAIASDGGNNLYTAGGVFRGAQFTPNDYDFFVAKISLIPEPGSLTLLIAGSSSLLLLRRPRR